MRITIEAETKDEKKQLGAKSVLFKNVTDYALIERSQVKGIISGEGFSRSGNILYLIGRLYSMITELNDTLRRNNP